MAGLDIVEDILSLIVLSLVFIGLGVLYFFFTMWLISTAAALLGLNVSGNFIVLTAGLVSAATILASPRAY